MADEAHVAVTGAAGYIGSRIVHQLQRDHPDWRVTAIDNFYLGDVRQIGDVAVRHVDVRDRNQLERALDGTDVVLHLAAISGVDDCEDDPDLGYEVNVVGTNNVAWFCRKQGAALSFPFSMAVLGDPETFPITVDHPRDPLNWYGWTKVLGERAVETFANGAFPAHQLMVANLYGEHEIGDRTVSKNTVINFFVERARSGDSLTVYEPGTQARNYVHVRDVATAFVRSAEQLVHKLETGQTGTEKYEIASNEDPSVLEIAELVQSVAAEQGIEVSVDLVENPRSGETLVEEFRVDTSPARESLNWIPEVAVEDAIRDLL